MTLRLSRVALALLCSLLAVATSASAECAWVMWDRTLTFGAPVSNPESITIVSAHTTKQDCEATAVRRLSGLLAANPVGTTSKDAYIESARQTSELSFEIVSRVTNLGRLTLNTGYMCLPDTVDPRGPKGK